MYLAFKNLIILHIYQARDTTHISPYVTLRLYQTHVTLHIYRTQVILRTYSNRAILPLYGYTPMHVTALTAINVFIVITKRSGNTYVTMTNTYL